LRPPCISIVTSRTAACNRAISAVVREVLRTWTERLRREAGEKREGRGEAKKVRAPPALAVVVVACSRESGNNVASAQT